eukprot:gene920-biopygen181
MRIVEMAMGPVSACNLTITPAFYFTQLDLSGPYMSYSPQHKRTTIKIWLIVFCCCSTSGIKIKTMDDYSTTAFIEAVTRFAVDHGFPKRLTCDEGSQLIKGCKEMKINILDIQQKLHRGRVDFQVCPVQGHNMNLSAIIANQINNLPLAIGDVSGDFECLNLITPNRLLLGRNNDRGIDGLILCDNPTKIIKDNKKAFNTWFDVCLTVHVPKLMKQSKWYSSDEINVGDVVLFIKHNSTI